MLKNKVTIVVMSLVLGIVVTYRLYSFMERNAKKGQKSQTSTPLITTESGPSVKVGNACVTTEKHEALLEHEVKSSSRNPFVEAGLRPVHTGREEDVSHLENAEVIQLPPMKAGTDRRLQSQQVETVSKKEENESENEKEEKSTEKLQPLEIKGIIVSSFGKSVIVNERVFSEGDYIGEERVVEIKPDSVVLEREGGRRELRLKQSSTPVKVRRLR